MYLISDYTCIFLVLLCLIPSYPLCHPILFVLSLSSLVFGFDFVVLGEKNHSHTTEKSLYLLVFQRLWLALLLYMRTVVSAYMHGICISIQNYSEYHIFRNRLKSAGCVAIPMVASVRAVSGVP